MRFGDDNQMHRPEGTAVVEGEHLFGFGDDIEGWNGRACGSFEILSGLPELIRVPFPLS